MPRQLHSVLGLFFGVLLILLGVTGALLSLDPALDRLAATVPRGVSVAEMAGRVARQFPGVEQIQRTPSGSLIVYYSTDVGAGVARIDPVSGAVTAYAPSVFFRWVKQLHRSMLLDTPGRLAAGLTALALLGLCVSGVLLLVKRTGGWRRVGAPLHGNWSQRWHAELGRMATAGLLLSALTGGYLSAATFGLVSDGMQSEPDFPAATSGGPPAPVSSLAALKLADLGDLRELVFPIPGDRAAVYTLRTMRGDGYVDQSTGTLLTHRPHSVLREGYELAYRLHTGEGLWWLGLLLGVCALVAPWLAFTGALVWWRRRGARPSIRDNGNAQSADTVILVGSENNSTWGFAQALHDALRANGLQVHTAPMNQLSARYRLARHLILLTATYGDGDAPATANRFLARLERIPANPALGFCVLGFGDRQFPKFCRFATEVDTAMGGHGWRRALELATIDRQSPQEFMRWGISLGNMLGIPLKLEHAPGHPPTFALRLRERVDYGLQEQEPTAVLRFDAIPVRQPVTPTTRLSRRRRLPHFEAGDLVGVVAPGSPVPRFYSLASGARDGVLEICVRRQPGGLCSGFLHSLELGACVEAFILPNPQFRPASGKAPVILIGAGTGIGPLAGFIRNNSGKHPMYLYWGGRDPESDFLYEPELRDYLADRRLTQLHAAFSRVKDGKRVQNRLIDDADNLRSLIAHGGQVLVCGSRAMAGSVRRALDDVLAPLGLDVQSLKSHGRYREDVF
jgi:sulfite reductase (NADPH) flavoprotein alpha-component